MSERAPLYGLLLAGGRSRRMGRDKALLRQHGENQLARGMRLLSTVVECAWVSTRPDQADEAERARYPRIIDRYTDMGPTAGILSAMTEAPHAAWLVLACDLPNIDASTLEALVAARDPARAATAFRSSHDGLPEPLCAIFEPQSRASIDAFVADGIFCPRKMLIRADTCLLDQPDPGALDNINTPDDLARTELKACS